MSENTGVTTEEEHPPHYEDVVQEDKKGGISFGKNNKGYASDASEVKVKVVNGDDIEVGGDYNEKVTLSEEEEQMLSVLREVVRKCTHANPTKRPTAAEVLKMLKAVKLPEIKSAK